MNTDPENKTGQLELFKGRPFENIFETFADQPRLQSVSILKSLSASEFHSSIVPAHYPIVFNSPTKYPPRDELLRRLSTDESLIKIRVGEYSTPPKKPATLYDREYATSSLSEYIQKYLFHKSSPQNPPYAGRIVLSPERRAELNCPPPNFFPESEFEPATTWLGGIGCTTPLHKDGSKNFGIHLFGKKKWTLFPPRDAHYLYLHRILPASDFAFSEVDLKQIDQKQFPLMRQAKSVSVTIEANQILYLPEGWTHFVENLKPTLMVNYWHKNHESES